MGLERAGARAGGDGQIQALHEGKASKTGPWGGRGCERANEDVLQIWGLSNEMMAFPFTLYTEGRRS